MDLEKQYKGCLHELHDLITNDLYEVECFV